jgi:hypothetical protein
MFHMKHLIKKGGIVPRGTKDLLTNTKTTKYFA